MKRSVAIVLPVSFVLVSDSRSPTARNTTRAEAPRRIGPRSTNASPPGHRWPVLAYSERKLREVLFAGVAQRRDAPPWVPLRGFRPLLSQFPASAIQDPGTRLASSVGAVHVSLPADTFRLLA